MNKVDTEVMEIEESVVQLQNLGSLNISEIIKSAQSQNGLKHSDYDRYRKYCSQKVKRIRKILRFSHGKKYASRDLVKEKPNDPRLLQVLLFQSEKNWAYAMYFKSQNQGDLKKKKPNRNKFRLRAKLRRALQWSKKLQDICETRTEKRTALESEAYAAFLEGLFDFEMERWEKAQDVYVKCRSIYTEIMKVSDSLQGVLYKEKIEQIDQALRYCNHKASKGKSMMTIENILEMKQHIKDPALNQKLEELLEQNRQNQIEQRQGLIEIQYHGEMLPIKNSKIINLHQKIQETYFNIKSNKDQINKLSINQGTENQIIELYEQNLENYIQLFSLYDDSLKLVTKDKDDTTNSEAEKAIFIKLIAYLNLQRQMAVLERNDAHIKEAVIKFLKEDGIQNLLNLSTKKAIKHKLTTPQEIVKHCDNYQQVLRQIQDVERMNPDLSMFKKLNLQEQICRALRCFFVSCLYYSNGKYQETVSMIKHNENLILNCNEKINDNKEFIDTRNQYDTFGFFPKLSAQLLLKCKLNALREQQSQQTEVGQKISQLSMEERSDQTKKSLYKYCKDLEASTNINIENIDQYRVADVADAMQLLLPRPIQFDLAYDMIQFPQLEEKKEEQKKGGFWNKINIFKK